MARKFLTNIDMNSNEVQNVVIHVLGVAPAVPTEGQIYYNSTDERLMLRQSSIWKDISGRIDDVLSGTTALIATDNGDNTITFTVLDATQTNSGFLPALDKILLDGATTSATPNTLVLRDVSGDITVNRATTTGITITGAIVNPTDSATKQYVDDALTTGLTFRGTIDCSVNPDYPAGVVGDAYIAQPGGLIGGGSGAPIEQGDWIICNTANAGGDEATVGSDWDIISNQVGDATELIAGKIRIATQAETNTGLIDTAAITPLKLKTVLDAIEHGAKKWGVDLGDNVSLSFVIAHGLGATDVQTQLYSNATGAIMECDMQVTDANNCLYSFTVAPTTNEYRAIILG